MSSVLANILDYVNNDGLDDPKKKAKDHGLLCGLYAYVEGELGGGVGFKKSLEERGECQERAASWQDRGAF